MLWLHILDMWQLIGEIFWDNKIYTHIKKCLQRDDVVPLGSVQLFDVQFCWKQAQPSAEVPGKSYFSAFLGFHVCGLGRRLIVLVNPWQCLIIFGFLMVVCPPSLFEILTLYFCGKHCWFHIWHSLFIFKGIQASNVTTKSYTYGFRIQRLEDSLRWMYEVLLMCCILIWTQTKLVHSICKNLSNCTFLIHISFGM